MIVRTVLTVTRTRRMTGTSHVHCMPLCPKVSAANSSGTMSLHCVLDEQIGDGVRKHRQKHPQVSKTRACPWTTWPAIPIRHSVATLFICVWTPRASTRCRDSF
jgi:hypothetical protein